MCILYDGAIAAHDGLDMRGGGAGLEPVGPCAGMVIAIFAHGSVPRMIITFGSQSALCLDKRRSKGNLASCGQKLRSESGAFM